MRPRKASTNETNISRNTNDSGSRYSTGFLFILPIIFSIILIGNVLFLVAIELFRVLRVPDLLVGSLTGISSLTVNKIFLGGVNTVSPISPHGLNTLTTK